MSHLHMAICCVKLTPKEELHVIQPVIKATIKHSFTDVICSKDNLQSAFYSQIICSAI